MTVSPVNYHSWRRFWARMFDYFLIGFLFLLLSRNSIFALNNIFLYSALQLIVVISAEAFMLARTGTTAGKSFLGLRVVSPSAPLDFNLAWKRTFWAYVKGLWLGIPNHDVRPRLVCAGRYCVTRLDDLGSGLRHPYRSRRNRAAALALFDCSFLFSLPQSVTMSSFYKVCPLLHSPKTQRSPVPSRYGAFCLQLPVGATSLSGRRPRE